MVRAEGRYDLDVSSKFVGRFGWVCTAQVQNLGRAYIRLWLVAIHAPLPGGQFRIWHRFSCFWWREFLQRRPVTIEYTWTLDRVHVRMWIDASGMGRWLALGLRFQHARWQCSQ